MDYEIEVVDVPAQRVIATKKHTNLDRIGSDIGTGFGAVMETMGRESIEASGPPLVVYLSMVDAESDFDIETCIPVNASLSSGSDVYGRELEGGPMATTIHHGPYEELTNAYQALTQWIQEHGHRVVGPPQETYLNDPQTVASSDLLTRIEFPVDSPS